MISILVVGDSSVGKTTLIKNLTGTPFNNIYESTSELYQTRFENYNFIDFPSKLKHSFDLSLLNYDIVFMMYDLTNDNSYNSINYWIKQINKPFIIIGNKTDCTQSIKDTNLIRSTSKQFDDIKISCVNNINIQDLLFNYCNYSENKLLI
tara:strand:- start:1720 stop:2169 length:450 start_codon:yes stop_codon:yes gene_type:complete